MCLHEDPKQRPTLGVLLGLLKLLDPLPVDGMASGDRTGGVLMNWDPSTEGAEVTMLDVVSPKPASGCACERFLAAVPAAAYRVLVELQENGLQMHPPVQAAMTAGSSSPVGQRVGSARARSTSLIVPADPDSPLEARSREEPAPHATPRGRLSTLFGRMTRMASGRTGD